MRKTWIVPVALSLTIAMLAPAQASTDGAHEPQIRSSASIPAYVDVVRAKKNAKPRIRVGDVNGRATITATLSNGRKVKRSKKLTRNKTWTFTLSQRTKNVRISGVRFKNATIKVPNRRYERTSLSNGNIIKGLTQSGGSSSDYRTLLPKTYRWDTCQYKTRTPDVNTPEGNLDSREIVTKVTDSNIIYYGGKIASRWEPLVRQALTEVERATGYKFVRTSKLPAINSIEFNIRNQGKLWSSEGTAVPTAYEDGSKYTPIVTAEVNASLNYEWGRNLPKSIVMHEIAHAVGLGHSKTKRQIMTASADNRTPKWGRGDLAGLKFLGKKTGCQLKVGDRQFLKD